MLDEIVLKAIIDRLKNNFHYSEAEAASALMYSLADQRTLEKICVAIDEFNKWN